MSPDLQHAQLLISQGRHRLALEKLQRALAADPEQPLAHALCALCHCELEQLQEATAEAEKAIAAAPDVSFHHRLLAGVLQARNRPAEALPVLDQAIELDPNDADNFALRSQLLCQLRRQDEALVAAEQGLSLEPHHLGCTNLRAMLLVQLNRGDEAGDELAAALAQDPDNPVTHANQGWRQLHAAQPQAALTHFQEALRLNPNLEWAQHGLLEALKARNPVYGLLLRYFLWMSRLKRRAQWGVIIGAYLIYRLLLYALHAFPQWAPLILPLIVAYVVFAFISWIGDALFDLLLRCSRYGRLALTRERLVASNWIGAVLALAVASAVLFLVLAEQWLLIAAIVLGLLLIPLAAATHCHAGWPKRVMWGWTGTLLLIGLAAVAAIGVAPPPNNPGLANHLLLVFVVGILLTGFVANAMMHVTPKR